MELKDFLNEENSALKIKFLGIFRDINSESSPKLLKQLDDRIGKQKRRLNHTRSREAQLKDKLSSVSEIISLSKAKSLPLNVVNILEGWRDELLLMIDKVETKRVEEKLQELIKIRDQIKRRAPFVENVLSEFGNDFNKS